MHLGNYAVFSVLCWVLCMLECIWICTMPMFLYNEPCNILWSYDLIIQNQKHWCNTYILTKCFKFWFSWLWIAFISCYGWYNSILWTCLTWREGLWPQDIPPIYHSVGLREQSEDILCMFLHYKVKQVFASFSWAVVLCFLGFLYFSCGMQLGH